MHTEDEIPSALALAMCASRARLALLGADNGEHQAAEPVDVIGAEGASALAKALPSCAKLATLSVSGNGIGAEGASALTKALPSCARLADLDVSGNGIGAEGEAALRSAASAVCPRLKLVL